MSTPTPASAMTEQIPRYVPIYLRSIENSNQRFSFRDSYKPPEPKDRRENEEKKDSREHHSTNNSLLTQFLQKPAQILFLNLNHTRLETIHADSRPGLADNLLERIAKAIFATLTLILFGF